MDPSEPKKKKKILVTGARGLFGCTLVPYLKACGHEVLCHSRKQGLEVCADLIDPKQAEASLTKTAPDVIVNLAALTSVDECEKHPHQAYLANTRIVENLVKWMQQTGTACHLIQMSTDQIYDGPGPHNEESITVSNYYGLSKYAGELAAATVPSTILRTNFFGASQCPGRRSLSDWLVQSLAEGQAITVFDDVRFSPLSLQRLVELVEFVIGQPRRGTYNLGARGGMTKADFAFTFAGVLGLSTGLMCRGASSEVKLSAYRPKDMRMDSSRFEADFGVELPTLKEEICSMKGAYTHETP